MPRLPQKRPMDNAVPNGTAQIAAINVAVREMRSDNPTMPHNVVSPDVIKLIVVPKISKICLSDVWGLALGVKLRKVLCIT